MKPESEAVLQAQTGSGWTLAAGLALASLVWLLLWYGQTSASLVEIWSRSETFAHGFLVAPVVAYLVWTRRAVVAALSPQPARTGLLALAAIGFGWLVANQAQVQVVQQLALVAMVPALVVAVLGWRIFRALLFPLVFLVMAVPFGEDLIPPLMDFTADFVVGALQAIGMPVYREGTFFTIPSGQWSVVEGCSGLRYLIASIFAGSLFAYLTYTSYVKRTVFILASVLVPIVANGMRATMIVLIAHYSDMKLALGVDHFIYGWVFFGLVILLMFWLGSFWRDPEPQAAAPAGGHGPVPLKPVLGATVAAVVVSGVWPVYADYLDRAVPTGAPPAVAAPVPAGGWQAETAPFADWAPAYKGTDAKLMQTYRKGEQRVSVFLGYYRHQRQDAELINSQNVMVHQKHPVWSNVGESLAEAGEVPVRQTLLKSAEVRLLIWDWFHVSGRDTTSPHLAKLLLARDRLLQQGDEGVAVILATPYQDRREPAQQALREFLREMGPSIRASVNALQEQ